MRSNALGYGSSEAPLGPLYSANKRTLAVTRPSAGCSLTPRHLHLVGQGAAGVETAAGLLCFHTGISGSGDERMRDAAWLASAFQGDLARGIPRDRRVGSFHRLACPIRVWHPCMLSLDTAGPAFRCSRSQSTDVEDLARPWALFAAQRCTPSFS